MTEIGDTAVHLIRVDADQNMARFYEMSVQPTFFGEATVFRNRGRSGIRGSR
ncbi:WGR domain-containing protein [Cypionkella sp.]|uniref:WGR domain-containing protein n=1 Tax=Cypionkella sp. TaxID=2811411 RepID=UPI003458D23D